MEKVKSNEKPKIEKVAPKEEDPGEPVEDESGYLVPAELLKAQREHSLEEKPPGGEGKERSSIGISLGEYISIDCIGFTVGDGKVYMYCICQNRSHKIKRKISNMIPEDNCKS